MNARRATEDLPPQEELSVDDDEIFMVSKNENVTFHSFTQTPWERYRVLFCYVREGIIDRATFDELVPKGFVADLAKDPPRIAVIDVADRSRLIEAFPEIAAAGRKYRPFRAFPTLLVMARMDRPYQSP